jgi:2-amino-4-hydroxy-6-hydroxymethyldihydropteridine diphosphokinase
MVAYVGLGSNLGHPRRQVARALADLARIPRSRLVATSRNYLSAPVGCDAPQPDYVNAVAMLRTGLAPAALLKHLHSIERQHGRTRRSRDLRNAARTLDLDLLSFGRRRSAQPGLTLPHPRMHQRAFVLRPLLDVAPSAAIPGRGSAQMLLRRVRDQRVRLTRDHTGR